MVDGRDRLVAVVGLEDVVIVETEDALLVCSRKNPNSWASLSRILLVKVSKIFYEANPGWRP